MMERIKRRWLFVLLMAFVLLMQACSSSAPDDKSDNSTSSEATTTEPAKASTEQKAADRGEAVPDSGESAADRSEEPTSSGASTSGQQGNLPDAGTLTAGEWDDNAKWSTWNKLMASNEGRENRPYWQFYDFRRLEVKVKAGGSPVADAAVVLTSKDGQQAWAARTNAAGVAYVFPTLFVEQGGDRKYTLSVTAGQQKKQFENVELKQGRSMEVSFDDAMRPSSLVDLMLVVDTTGSMSDELRYLEAELKDVVTRVSEQNNGQLDIRVSSNFYRDEHDDYVVRPFPFTRDVDKAVDQIADQEAFGGGDFPEAVELALSNAIEEHEWSKEALARLMFVVLDAPPHHEPQIMKKLQKLTAKAAEQGIRIIPIASSGVDIATEHLMRYIAVSTGGTYVFLTDHSGVGGDHLKPAVGEYEVRALNDLMVDVITRYCRS
ncbi:von Willebrand factor type A [Paenibacillus curdlanolyticus YK9]|uniref:von Willebrand factor type A n=1 Tax=Paenibacillus curdlanolyticus YK9 TaxID=717606 RepID=E0I6I9_9BACL|nr:VWA domain-containing protein [Paenibacillus curdlanolyticus]EFM11655.1 von Willebrand factor type A [Paenibacillus curdlanolyticus YK9]